MSQEVAPEFSHNYVAFFLSNAGDGWMPEATAQIGSWLREKNFDVALDNTSDQTLDNAKLAVRVVDDGSNSDLRVTLVEVNDGGTWKTDLIVHDARHNQVNEDWISLSVQSGDGRFVSVPRLANYLMQVLPLTDGVIPYHASQVWVRADDIPKLRSSLADPERSGLVFVAGTTSSDDISAEAFAKQIGKWSKEIYGLGHVYVLDPEATTRFAEEVGNAFAAPPWAIRTYHREVNFGDSVDAHRHRILGTKWLTSHGDKAVQRLLGDVARQEGLLRPSYPQVARVLRRFERLENERLAKALAPLADRLSAPSSPIQRDAASGSEVLEHVEALASLTTTEAPRATVEAEVAMVRRLLGVERITEEVANKFELDRKRAEAELNAMRALQGRLTELQANLEHSEDEVGGLTKALDDEQAENELVRFENDDLRSKIRFLEGRLAEEGDYLSAYQDVPEEFREDLPRDFEELLERVERMDGVSFTGDEQEVERLNQVDTNSSAVRTAWEAIKVLQDYVQARLAGKWDQGLAKFISDPPSGCHSISPKKFGETETGITMKRFGDERLFPVPTSISPTGQQVMKTHFKLARIGMVSPRMYVYDGFPAVPQVFIGYIGVHLTNTQSR